jgi:hypothetical protein
MDEVCSPLQLSMQELERSNEIYLPDSIILTKVFYIGWDGWLRR